MGSRGYISARLGKRVNLLAPMGVVTAIGVLQRVVGAGADRPPVAARSASASAAWPPDGAVLGEEPQGSANVGARRRPAYYALLNLGAVFIVAGVVTVVSTFLFAIPVALFVAVFASACWFLAAKGVRAAARGSPAGAILCGWAALAFALVVFAGAQWAGLTGFVPDLVLVWLVGVLALGLLAPGTGLLTVAATAVALWTSLAYLYDRSYLPAVAALVALHWVAARGAASRWFIRMLTLATAVVAAAYLHDVIRPGHYPLAPGAGDLLAIVAVLAAMGALWSAASVMWMPAPIRGAVSKAGRSTVRACGLAVLAAAAVKPVWDRLGGGFDHSRTALTAGGALLVFAAVVLWNVPVGAADRLRFAWSALVFAALAGALYGVPPAFATAAPLLAALWLSAVVFRHCAANARRGRFLRMSVGVSLMVLVAAVTLAGWHARLGVTATVLIALGLAVLAVARRWTPAAEWAAAQTETGTLALVADDEGAADGPLLEATGE